MKRPEDVSPEAWTLGVQITAMSVVSKLARRQPGQRWGYGRAAIFDPTTVEQLEALDAVVERLQSSAGTPDALDDLRAIKDAAEAIIQRHIDHLPIPECVTWDSVSKRLGMTPKGIAYRYRGRYRKPRPEPDTVCPTEGTG